MHRLGRSLDRGLIGAAAALDGARVGDPFPVDFFDREGDGAEFPAQPIADDPQGPLSLAAEPIIRDQNVANRARFIAQGYFGEGVTDVLPGEERVQQWAGVGLREAVGVGEDFDLLLAVPAGGEVAEEGPVPEHRVSFSERSVFRFEEEADPSRERAMGGHRGKGAADAFG